MNKLIKIFKKRSEAFGSQKNPFYHFLLFANKLSSQQNV